jgi:hypothetical protein
VDEACANSLQVAVNVREQGQLQLHWDRTHKARASTEIASRDKRHSSGKARKAEMRAMARIIRAKKFSLFLCNAASRN